jgi:type I restriction-modification system DNA methylase subunit
MAWVEALLHFYRSGGMTRKSVSSKTTEQATACSEHQERKAFIDLFNTIARHRHRYEVFKDFVTMAAFSVHNAVRMDEKLEAEYMSIVQRYTKEEAISFSHLLTMLVNMLQPAPRDVLGTIFMELDFGGTHNGQFFTPHHISELMALIAYGEQLESLDVPFVTLCEPACGAGGMVLAFVKVLIDKGHNPAKRLWVQCQDIDRTAALMCYLQLSLWHVAGVVIVGNTLANEQREVFYTPAHHLEFWRWKLEGKWKRKAEADIEQQGDSADGVSVVSPVSQPIEAATLPAMPADVPAMTMQVDFGF